LDGHWLRLRFTWFSGNGLDSAWLGGGWLGGGWCRRDGWHGFRLGSLSRRAGGGWLALRREGTRLHLPLYGT
jgi:hypothetical protein